MTPLEARSSRLGPAVAALLTVGLHALGWDRYGVFRDELYFIACGQRLDWGYVDQPPGIALVARQAHGLFGEWVPGLRVLPWLAAGAAVYLAGRLAVRLGGGAFAATLASVAVAASPLLRGVSHQLTMNAFELPLVLALVHVLLALADGAPPRRWLLAAVLAATAVLFKYSAALLAVTLVAGLVLTPARRALATRHALLGGALALLLVAPNFLWQAAHGFPFLELVDNGVRFKNAPVTPLSFLTSVVLEAGPLHALLWAGGLVALLAGPPGRRWLGLGLLGFLLVLLASRGKPYYFSPALPVLLAAGAVALEARLRAPFARVAVPAALVAGSLAFLPFAIPLLPEETFLSWQTTLGFTPSRTERHATGPLPQTWADQHGWKELAAGVAALVRTFPEEERRRAVIFGQNYGQAAALQVFGPALGLDVPAIAGHNQYWLWGVPAGRGDPSFVIGDEDEDCGGAFTERVRVGALPEVPWAIPSESGRTLWLCRGLTVPLEQLWPRVRRYI